MFCWFPDYLPDNIHLLASLCFLDFSTFLESFFAVPGILEICYSLYFRTKTIDDLVINETSSGPHSHRYEIRHEKLSSFLVDSRSVMIVQGISVLGRDQDRGGELPTQPQVCPWFRSGEQKRRRILAPHTSPVIIDDASSSESRGTARLLVCKQTVTAERFERVLLSQPMLYIGIF